MPHYLSITINLTYRKWAVRKSKKSRSQKRRIIPRGLSRGRTERKIETVPARRRKKSINTRKTGHHSNAEIAENVRRRTDLLTAKVKIATTIVTIVAIVTQRRRRKEGRSRVQGREITIVNDPDLGRRREGSSDVDINKYIIWLSMK